ncbi:hypothetical protein DVK02_01295 [Halobellus sp. Atlit-31R]|nr:hypothetical protein DVK02_01295 [Halobellus sp. Atlit-31R]
MVCRERSRVSMPGRSAIEGSADLTGDGHAHRRVAFEQEGPATRHAVCVDDRVDAAEFPRREVASLRRIRRG